MTSRSRSRSRSWSRPRGRNRLRTARSQNSRSPSPNERPTYNDRDDRGRSSPHHRNGRHPEDSRSPSRGRSRSRSYSRDRSYAGSPAQTPVRSTKIVVERLTKNVNEDHLWEIFGQYGEIGDLDLPMNRQSNTNRGTAYILYAHEADAEAAIAHMHEAQLDGAIINVSIVLPRRKFSPSPPTARRGANFDPRNPPLFMRGAPGGPAFGGFGRGRRSPLPAAGSSRYGPRSDTYRPLSRSRSRSPQAAGGSRRYRSRSRSFSSRSRSRSPAGRAGGGGRGGRSSGGARRYGEEEDGRDRRRSPSYDSYGRRSRSRSRG